MFQFLLPSLALFFAFPTNAKTLVRTAPIAVKSAPSVLVPTGLTPVSLRTSLITPTLEFPNLTVAPILPEVQAAVEVKAVRSVRAVKAPTAKATSRSVSIERSVTLPKKAKFARAIRALPKLSPPNAKQVQRASGESLKTASLSFFAGNAADAVGVSVEGVPASARNKTANLLKQYQRVRDGKAGNLPKRASRYRYLLVPGLSHDAVPDYMEPNLKRLEALGLDAEKVETHPFGDPADNAKIIAERVLASDKPVVIIGHSKGGIDSLTAIENEKGVAAKISRFVAIQSPYFGSDLADWFEARPFLMSVSMTWLRAFRGNPLGAPFPWAGRAAITKLTRRIRSMLPDARPKGVRTRTKFYSIVSRVDGGASTLSWPLWAKTGFTKSLSGKDNDGIVVPEDAVYPDSDYAWLEEVGHVDTIADDRSWKSRTFGVRGQDEPFAEIMTEAIVRWIHEPRPRPASGAVNAADQGNREPREEGFGAMVLGLSGLAAFLGVVWWGLNEAAPFLSQAMYEFERFLIEYSQNPF